MVRGPDSVDLGVWPFIDRAQLLVPLDTHVARIARFLGLTRRTDLSWRTAEEITAALAPFERGAGGENPYNVQQDLQDAMQKLVGIVRNEPEMREALGRIQDFKQRAARLGAEGHREYHSGWHTSIDVANLLAVSEAITLSALGIVKSSGLSGAGSSDLIIADAVNTMVHTVDPETQKPAILAGTNSGLYRSVDPSKGWEKLSYGSIDPRTTCISTTPEQPETIP